MKKLLLTLITAILFLLAGATDYHFATAGNDANAGTQASPKKSLSVAQSLCVTGNNIYFNRGDIWYGSFNPQGSGSAGTRITVGAYGSGANPIITGFTAVTTWTNLGGNIWESTSAVSTLSTLKMVTINGINVPVGSFPNPATTEASPLPSVHPIAGNGGWRNFQTRYRCGSGCTNPSGWWINDTYLTGSPNWNGGQVVIKTVNWVIDIGTITSHSGQRVNYTPTAIDGGEYSEAYAGMSYFIQDHPSTLTYQNAWYYDKTTKKLKIYSTSQPTNVQVASVSTLVSVSTARSYITFQNIDLVGSNSDMISLPNNCTNWKFTDCLFEFAGRDAVYTNWMSNSDFLRCVVKDAANNGIMLREGCNNNSFVNNTVLRAGVFAGQNDQSRWFSGEGIHSIGDNNTFTGNNVSYVGMNGIRFGGSSVLVNKNFIDNYCYSKSDGGAVYVWGINGGQNWTGITIEDNICLNGSLRGSIGTWLENEELAVKGIYLDATTKNVTIQRNSVAYTVGAGIYLNNPLNCVVRYNNVFDARYAALHLNRYNGNGTMNFKATGNILVAKKLGSFVTVPQTGKNPPTQSNQRTFYYKQDAGAETLTGNVTTLDSNIYARPIDDYRASGIGTAEVTGMGTIKSISLVAYNGSFTGAGEYAPQTTYGLDAFKSAFTNRNQNSSKSPIGIDDTTQLRFEYNWSVTPVNINLGATYMDMYGNSSSSITLQPYTSKTLILTGASFPPTSNAGADKTIYAPTTQATLTGSGTGGSGTVSSYAWSQISGSATTITSPSSATTTVSGLTGAGTYGYRLGVTNSLSATTYDSTYVTSETAQTVTVLSLKAASIRSGISVSWNCTANSNVESFEVIKLSPNVGTIATISPVVGNFNYSHRDGNVYKVNAYQIKVNYFIGDPTFSNAVKIKTNWGLPIPLILIP